MAHHSIAVDLAGGDGVCEEEKGGRLTIMNDKYIEQKVKEIMIATEISHPDLSDIKEKFIEAVLENVWLKGKTDAAQEISEMLKEELNTPPLTELGKERR